MRLFSNTVDAWVSNTLETREILEEYARDVKAAVAVVLYENDDKYHDDDASHLPQFSHEDKATSIIGCGSLAAFSHFHYLFQDVIDWSTTYTR